MLNYWLFGGPNRDQVIPVSEAPAEIGGEECVNCTAEEAAQLQRVPVEFRWEAAQGESWNPSPEFNAWKAKRES